MSYLLGQYSPYTFTVALLDTTDPASLLTLHLYMYSPIVSVISVVYDFVLSLLTVVQLLPELLLSQEYTSVPKPLVLHMRVMFLPIGTSPPAGLFVISGGPIKHNHNCQTVGNCTWIIKLRIKCKNARYSFQ